MEKKLTQMTAVASPGDGISGAAAVASTMTAAYNEMRSRAGTIGTPPRIRRSAIQPPNSAPSDAKFGGIQANSANQYNARFSGNAQLSPEKADTYTAGVVLQPRWVPGLAFTVDYFNIKVKNLISTYGFQNIMNSQPVFGAGRNNIFPLAANEINNLIFHHFRIGTFQVNFI